MNDSTVGVPLIVHVLLSMFKPDGSAGEMPQVAPVTLVMPPLEPPPEPLPEPLAALESYWKVISSMRSPTIRSAPSELAVRFSTPAPSL